MTTADLIRIELPATTKYLNVLGVALAAVLERAAGVGAEDPRTYDVQLAVHEICTNIVEHAYGGDQQGRIEVLLEIASEPRALIVELADRGVEYARVEVAAPDPSLLLERGYGLYLAQELMDSVAYRREATRNCWRLVKNL